MNERTCVKRESNRRGDRSGQRNDGLDSRFWEKRANSDTLNGRREANGRAGRDTTTQKLALKRQKALASIPPDGEKNLYRPRSMDASGIRRHGKSQSAVAQGDGNRNCVQ